MSLSSYVLSVVHFVKLIDVCKLQLASSCCPPWSLAFVYFCV